MRFALAAAGAVLSLGLAAQGLDTRQDVIARAKVWTPIATSTLDLRAGPRATDGFLPDELVVCDYLDKTLSGHSRKFACLISPGDEVKVKFGGANGEVQGEVAATRLMWALGFGADRMYPVRIICRGCPETYGQPGGRPGERLIEPAVIERKLPGREVQTVANQGWSWLELDLTDERGGGATPAERDALKLLAVLLQHTDTKPEQQRLLCLGEANGSEGDRCAQPFMMLNDVGLTFGRANLSNASPTGSVNLDGWSETPVWKGPTGCVGNLPRSFTGTLKDPFISEDGRLLLARLLLELSDKQLHDLFAVARVNLRSRSPDREPATTATVDEWVDVFKQKRKEITDRRCVVSWSSWAPGLFDTAPVLWLQSWSSPALTATMNGISLFGYTAFYLAISACLALAYRLRAGVALMVLLALTASITDATKTVVSQPRPTAVDSRVQALSLFQPAVDSADVYGFPSGHVAAATAFLLGLALLFKWRAALAVSMVWVPLMATSRMYLGQHFIGDVLGGVAVGVVTSAIGLLGLTLGTLGDPRRQRRVVARTLLVAIGVAVLALFLGFPSLGNAGRLLGLTIGMIAITWMNAPDASTIMAGVGRVACAAALVPVAWYGSWGLLDAVGAGELRAADLAAHAAVGLLVVAGPLWLESVVSGQLSVARSKKRV